MKTKLVIVTYSHGREGTSALMGTLKCLGYNVPDKVGASKMNPKGFFEDPGFDQKVFELYNRSNGDLSLPPTPNEIEASVNQNNIDILLNELKDLVGSNNKFALKSARYLLLPFINELKIHYDVKIIHTFRKEKDHINSIYRVWQSIDHIENDKKNMKKRDIKKWVNEWKVFGKNIIDSIQHPVLEIGFDELIKYKENNLLKLADFLDEETISVEIFKWLEPKLVNRKRL